jgi:alpha-mannosidase
MPHDTFWWQGVDGSEVMTYFITGSNDWRPEDLVRDPGNALREYATYNGDMSVRQIMGSWVRYREKGLNTETLYSFGYGDGGGGPTEKMLEYADRLRDYAGLPKVVQGGAEQFFTNLRERLLDNPRTPRWVGELYFEYHRGTYTSQARVKWDNRRAEEILHDAELWCAWAEALGSGEAAWREALRRCWELVLLNQFHDILPGSSIGEVYLDQRRQHAEVQARAGAVLKVAQDIVARTIAAPVQSVAVFNASPFPRSETVHIDLPPNAQSGATLVDAGGRPLLTQPVEGVENAVLVAGLTVPPLGYTVVTVAPGTEVAAESELSVSERVLENRFFRLELDEQGNFASLYDKRWHREVLAGPGNRLVAFEDKPISYDAWDIDRFYAEKPYPLDVVSAWRVVEQGPVRAGVELVRHWGPSTIRQRIFLHAETPRLDIQTHIEWHHRQVLLKAAFPLAVHATQATYECAFGHLQRPTHRNTSWDEARFEVPAHRWADLSEAGYGVSLLNDGKYGYDCLGSVLRLTLLKSGIQPDPQADEGEHHFAYALLPHGPDWSIEDTVAAGYNFNLPVHSRLVGGGSGTALTHQSFVVSDSVNAVVDTVKPAEDGDGIIVRVYDCANHRGTVRLTLAHAPASAESVTILEQPDAEAGPITLAGDTLSFDLLPFQVRSFRLRL